MTFLYQEIEDFAKIFNVEARGQAVIAGYKKREADLRAEFGKNKKTFRLSSGSPAPHLPQTPTWAAKNIRHIANVLGGHNAITL